MINFIKTKSIRKLIYLVLLISHLISSQVKIQLDENFEFLGLNNYDLVIKKNITELQKNKNKIDTLISKCNDDSELELLNVKRYKLEQSSLDYEIKNYLQELLLKYYDSNTIELRLHNMFNSKSSRNQEYVYLKANISKINKVEFTIGGNLDLNTAKTKGRTGSNAKEIGVKESIMTVTAGIEIYNLSTGELYYTNVYTYGSKVKRDLDNPLSDQEIIQIYKKDLLSLFDNLVKQTSLEYNPSVKTAVIVKSHRDNTFIIDKGTDDGFIVGKTATLEGSNTNFNILEAGPKLALIKPFTYIDNSCIGKKIKLFGNKIDNSNKPKVLVTEVEFLDSFMFDDELKYDKATITQWFKDNLSIFCNLFIVPSDPREINNFQEEVSLYGNTSSKQLFKKLIKPDYVIYPKIIYAYSQDTEGQIETGFQTYISSLEALIEIQLIDFNTGMILKTKRLQIFRNEEQSDIAKVHMSDLFPALLKDGIITLCEQLSNDLSVNKIEAIVQNGKNNIHDIEYIIGSDLKNGEIFKVYRRGIEVNDLNGNYIAHLEDYIGDIRVIKSNNSLTVTPYMPWIKIKKGDIIRGYTSSAQLSENLVTIKMNLKDDENIKAIFSKSKTDNQKPLPKNLVLSNYYYTLSNNPKITPILDQENQEFLYALKDIMNRGYYERRKEYANNNISIKYYSDMNSTIYEKNNVHESRIDLRYASRIRLYSPDNLNEPIYGVIKGVEKTIGDNKSSTRKDKMRAKKNRIIKGLSPKDINREFFDANISTFKQVIDEISLSLN